MTSWSSAVGATSGCPWRSRWRAAASDGRLRRLRDARSTGSATRRCRSSSRAPTRCSPTVVAARHAHRVDRSRRRRDRRERHRRHRHAGRRAPQPRPERDPARARRRARRSSATASCSCCAAPSTPASPRWSSDMIADLGVDMDVAFCPERIAEHKAMEELFALPQIVSARAPNAVAARRRAVRHADRVRSSSSSPKRPSSRSCSPTRGATSSSPRPTSST